MFTGLVQRLGTLSSLSRSGSGAALAVALPTPWPDPLVLGESIAVQGACLTVSRILPGGFIADVLEETLDCTALGALRSGARLNLERALAVGDRLGGHIVQGHVDALGRVVSIRPRGRDIVFRVGTDSATLRQLVYKGSIAIDGVSLTVSSLHDEELWFEVNLIPTTLGDTTLSDRHPGDSVNLETDILGKYIERLLAAGTKAAPLRPGLTLSEFIALD
jgi:riboflavin synthase